MAGERAAGSRTPEMRALLDLTRRVQDLLGRDRAEQEAHIRSNEFGYCARMIERGQPEELAGIAAQGRRKHGPRERHNRGCLARAYLVMIALGARDATALHRRLEAAPELVRLCRMERPPDYTSVTRFLRSLGEHIPEVRRHLEERLGIEVEPGRMDDQDARLWAIEAGIRILKQAGRDVQEGLIPDREDRKKMQEINWRVFGGQS